MKNKTLFILSETNLGFLESIELLDKYNQEYSTVKIDNIENDESIIDEILEKEKEGYTIVDLDEAILELYDASVKLADLEYVEFKSYMELETGETDSSYFLLKSFLNDEEITVHEAVLHELLCHKEYSVFFDLEGIIEEYEIDEKDFFEEVQEIAREYHIRRYMYLDDFVSYVKGELKNDVLYITSMVESIEYALDEALPTSFEYDKRDYIRLETEENYYYIFDYDLSTKEIIYKLLELDENVEFYAISDDIYNDLFIIHFSKEDNSQARLDEMDEIIFNTFHVKEEFNDV